MSYFVRAALVEYGTDVLGPLPNIVVFQFNPEQISRSFQIPPRTTESEAAGQREPGQAGSAPVESFTITAQFTAADDLGDGEAIPRLFGVGPQLAALEQMVYPAGGLFSAAIGAVIDAVGDALNIGGDDEASQAIPRQQVPRLLFIWGPSRVVPVEITSFSITEQEFDFLLNPVRAEVQIGMSIAALPADSTDIVAQGALLYTQTVKDAQSVLNLAKAAELALDVIPF